MSGEEAAIGAFVKNRFEFGNVSIKLFKLNDERCTGWSLKKECLTSTSASFFYEFAKYRDLNTSLSFLGVE